MTAPVPAPTSTVIDPTALVGTMSKADVDKVINGQMAAFDKCYTLGADKQGKLEGTITMKVTVGPLGQVKDATVEKSTVKNTKVDKCVKEAFKKMKFPQPKGGTAIINYPLTFGGEMVQKK